MSNDETGGTVTFLRPRTGGDPPGLPPLPGRPPDPPAGPSSEPSSAPPHEGSGAAFVSDRQRRSAGDSLAALPVDPPALPAPRPGHVPATFRNEPEGSDGQRPGLGALSLSAILAVALAALRGTAGAMRDWRQRRMEREAEAEPLRKARLKLGVARLGTDAAIEGKRHKVPSSLEFGRKSHNARGRSGSSGRGAVPGRTGSGLGSSKPNGSLKGGSAKRPALGGGASKSGALSGGKPGMRSGMGRGGAATGGSGKPGEGLKSGKSGGRLGTGLGAGRGFGKGLGKGKHGGGSGKPGKLGKGPGKLFGLGTAEKDRKDGRKARTGGRTKHGKASEGGKGGPWKARDERVTLGKAVGDGAGRRVRDRFNSRWNHPDPPFLRRDRKAADGASQRAGDGPKGQKSNEGTNGREKAAHDPSGGEHDHGSGDGAWKEYARASSWTPPPRGERRSAEDSARDATDEGTTITVERANRPGDNEPSSWQPGAPAAVTTGVRGLPRAPHRPAGPRPGTARTTRTEGARVSVPIRMPGAGGVAAAEHMTEVTLDDVLDHLAESRQRCFDTYDECARLADKALKLRDALGDLSYELAQYHNVIGRLTSAAMARLAESMDLLARKAEEMRTECLTAAESVEVAHNEMHDAYRPVQQAAADAGLHMPSARIHNED